MVANSRKYTQDTIKTESNLRITFIVSLFVANVYGK